MNRKQQNITATLNDFYHKPVAKVSLEVFLSILLILFLGVFAIQPTLVVMSDLITEIEEKEELDQDLQTKIVALNSASVQYELARNDLALLDEAIPSRPELIRSLKTIEKLATDGNVIINSATVAEIPPETLSESTSTGLVQNSIAVSLNIQGDYISIKNFVQTLLDSRRSYVVDTISFSINEKRNFRSLSANITINMPYFGDSN